MADDAAAQALKRAVNAQPDSPYLETRIREAIRRREARRLSWLWPALAAAAMLLVSFGFWTAYQAGHFRLTAGSQEAYLQAVSGRIAPVLAVGLGDHVHCAVFARYPRQVRSLGPGYDALVGLVRTHLPAGYRLIAAHRCTYRGRKFVHLIVQGDSALVSVIVTGKREGESLQNGLQRAGVQRYEAAGFETAGHLAYVVSDLGPAANLNLLAGLAPGIREILRNTEGKGNADQKS